MAGKKGEREQQADSDARLAAASGYLGSSTTAICGQTVKRGDDWTAEEMKGRTRSQRERERERGSRQVVQSHDAMIRLHRSVHLSSEGQCSQNTAGN